MTKMIAFIHIEKAAGSTLNHILRRSFGGRHCDIQGWRRGWCVHRDCVSAADLRRSRWLYWHLESIAGHGVKPHSDLGKECRDIRYYTFLREPIARCVSHYQYQVQKMNKLVSFEQWIQDPLYRNFQVKKIAGMEDVDRAIDLLRRRVEFVGLVERFGESLVMLRRQFPGIPLRIQYRRKNVASNQRIRDEIFARPEYMAALTEANALDVKLYDFVSNTLFPDQISRYEGDLENDVRVFNDANKVAGFWFHEAVSGAKRLFLYRPAIRAYQWFAR